MNSGHYWFILAAIFIALLSGMAVLDSHINPSSHEEKQNLMYENCVSTTKDTHICQENIYGK